jgi:predicted nucleic acid-binding protein
MPDAKVFIDTNVWVYAHLKSADDGRHALALARIEREPNVLISPQVVAEYYSVMLRNGRQDAWIQANLRAIFARTRLQPANAGLLNAALDLRNRYGFSFWDCQIVAAALLAGCEVLLTEDLQHGQVIDDRLRIVNPFAEH